MSNRTLPPLAAAESAGDPVVRFQHAVSVQFAIAELERRVQALARQLAPGEPARSRPRRRARRGAWEPAL